MYSFGAAVGVFGQVFRKDDVLARDHVHKDVFVVFFQYLLCLPKSFSLKVKFAHHVRAVVSIFVHKALVMLSHDFLFENPIVFSENEVAVVRLMVAGPEILVVNPY